MFCRGSLFFIETNRNDKFYHYHFYVLTKLDLATKLEKQRFRGRKLESIMINKDELENSLYAVIALLSRQAGKKQDYGLAYPLYTSEIHTIHLIGKYNGISPLKLSEELNITKGAVSQTLTKLEKKGMIKRVKTGESVNRVLVYLTEEGQQVYEQHRRKHESKLERVYEYISSLPEEKSACIEEFIHILSEEFREI